MNIDTEGLESFIPTEKIEELLQSEQNPSESQIREIILKAWRRTGLHQKRQQLCLM